MTRKGWSEPWVDGHAVRFGTSRFGRFRRWCGTVQYSTGTTGGTCADPTGRSGPLDALASEFDSISWAEEAGRYDIFVLDANVVANIAIEPVGGRQPREPHSRSLSPGSSVTR